MTENRRIERKKIRIRRKRFFRTSSNAHFVLIRINNSFLPLAETENTLSVIRKIRSQSHLLQLDRHKKLRMTFFCLRERNHFALSSAIFMNAKIPHIQSCNPFIKVDGLRGNEKNNYRRKKQYNSPINFPLSPLCIEDDAMLKGCH